MQDTKTPSQLSGWDAVTSVAQRIQALSEDEKEILWHMVHVGRKIQPRLDPQSIAFARRHMEGLTSREREVMSLIVSGLRNKEIAIHLGISPRTVETHRLRVMSKLGAQNVAHLCSLVASAMSDDETRPAPTSSAHPA